MSRASYSVLTGGDGRKTITAFGVDCFAVWYGEMT
jgi:hypothetical protein